MCSTFEELFPLLYPLGQITFIDHVSAPESADRTSHLIQHFPSLPHVLRVGGQKRVGSVFHGILLGA